MKVVAIIQARMRSVRLPGKIMKKLSGRTVLEHDIIRIGSVSRVDEVVVATSNLVVDDEVAAEALRAGAKVSRGSEEDVLARFHDAAREYGADVIVRMTSDCPLFDPELLDEMLAEFLTALQSDAPFDYYSNTLKRRTYPTGLDAEIFTRAALERAFHEGCRPPEREHVTPYLHQNPHLFNLGGMESAVDHSAHRWTLDTPADLELIERIYDAIYSEDRLFTTNDVLQLLVEHPEISAINRHIEAKSIEPVYSSGLVIRADASPDIGAGHVMRCLALGQAWPADAGPVVFVMAEGAAAYGPRLRHEGFAVEAINATAGTPEDAAATMAVARRHTAGWLVIDGYFFDQDYVNQLLTGNSRVLQLDDNGQPHLPPVDILLNQNLHADVRQYPDRSPEANLFLGVEHVLLRQEFLNCGRQESELPDVVNHILVTLGGGDPENIVSRVLVALKKISHPDLHVRVLVGANSPHRSMLTKLAEQSPHQVEIQSPTQDMPPQYEWADLAITGGGGTLWELAYIGVPALTFILAANQQPSSRLLAEKGVINCLGRLVDLSDEEITAAIRELVEDKDMRARMVTKGKALIDGQGAQRVADAMLKTSRAEVIS